MSDPIHLDTLAATRGVHAVWCFCAACRRSRKLNLDRTASRLGWEFPDAGLRSRLACGDCGQRTPEIRLVYDLANGGPQPTA